MNTPYNTGKVLIGSTYLPPPKAWAPSRTELALQAALLKRRCQPAPVPAGQTDWDGVAIVAGCIALALTAYAWLWGAL